MLEVVSDKISLTGENGILNRSLIVHALPDDYKSDPAGMTGARERCGIIARVRFEGTPADSWASFLVRYFNIAALERDLKHGRF